MDDILETIREAIENRKVIKFKYGGHERRVQPHHYGTRSNDTQLHAYQLDGKSSSGGLPQWRDFKINAISNLSLQNETDFEPRADYKPENSKYKTIEFSVNDFSFRPQR